MITGTEGRSAKPERVCPAGSLRALPVAVDADADAVYPGMRDSTNARDDAAWLQAVGAFGALAARLVDPDPLFFERRLLVEGDTEYGLLLKDTLDAIVPLLPGVLARG